MFRNGLKSLLHPEDSILVLIDHLPYLLANLNSRDPQTVVNNVSVPAKLAKAFHYYLGLRDRNSVYDQGDRRKLDHTIGTCILGDTGSTYSK